MKIRTGFVSNSSSSSFVAVFRDNDIAEKQLQEVLSEKEYAEILFSSGSPTRKAAEGKETLVQVVERRSVEDGDNSVDCVGAENVFPELKRQIREEYSSDSEWEKDLESVIKEASALHKKKGPGWDVALYWVSYHDEELQDALRKMEGSGDAVIWKLYD